MSGPAFSWVMERSPMTGTGLIIHFVLAEAVDSAAGNDLLVDQSVLADHARSTRGTVNRVLADLVSRGLLEVVTSTPWHPNRYRLLMPNPYPAHTGPPRRASRHVNP